MDRKCGFLRIIRNDFRRAARRREQYVFLADFGEMVYDRSNDGCFSGSGVAFQNKNFVLVVVGDEFRDLLEEYILLRRRLERKISGEDAVEGTRIHGAILSPQSTKNLRVPNSNISTFSIAMHRFNIF